MSIRMEFLFFSIHSELASGRLTVGKIYTAITLLDNWRQVRANRELADAQRVYV